MPHVALAWYKLAWLPKHTWKKDIVPQLAKLGIAPADIERCVYVIRLDGEYCIAYPKGESPAIYIGEGNFHQRIESHKDWLLELEHLVSEFDFQICIAIPKVGDREGVHCDAEAALIQQFHERYGTTPLWNKQLEKRRQPDLTYAPRSLNEAVGIRSGTRYNWAIKPMKSSAFYKHFGPKK